MARLSPGRDQTDPGAWPDCPRGVTRLSPGRDQTDPGAWPDCPRGVTSRRAAARSPSQQPESVTQAAGQGHGGPARQASQRRYGTDPSDHRPVRPQRPQTRQTTDPSDRRPEGHGRGAWRRDDAVSPPIGDGRRGDKVQLETGRRGDKVQLETGGRGDKVQLETGRRGDKVQLETGRRGDK